MSFTDDLKKVIDDILGAPPEQRGNMWAQLKGSFNSQGLNLNGISNLNPNAPVKPGQTSAHNDSGVIQNIIQQQQRAFQTILITPMKILQSVSPCTLSNVQILENSMYDANFVTSQVKIGTFWRTIVINNPGTFLKFEYYQNQVNYTDGSEVTTDTGGNTDTNTDNILSDDTQENPRNNSTFDSTADFTGRGDARYMQQLFLIQFEDASAPIIKVNHNDIFRVSFSKIFLHIRITNPRLLVTIGNGSEIVPSSDGVILSKDLALGPGYGIWGSNVLHPVSFSINSNTPFKPQPNFVAGTTTGVKIKLIDQTPNNPAGSYGNNIGNGGVAVLWICRFNISMQVTSTATQCVFAIVILDSSDNFVKTVSQIDLDTPASTTQSVTISEEFSTPRRVVLHNSYKLALFYRQQLSSNFNFNVDGYSMGSVRAITSFATAQAGLGTPYYLPTYAQNPFPGDWGSGVNDNTLTKVDQFP